jgi:hypothetical protein
MKNLILTFGVATLLVLSTQARSADLAGLGIRVFPTNDFQSAVDEQTNLVSFSPFAKLASLGQLLKTNGLECSFEPTSGWVYIQNHTTNDTGCLRMPATNLFRIALLDERGRQVEKTPFGSRFGWPLLEPQIDAWLHHGRLLHQSKFVHFLPKGVDKFDVPTPICTINLKDAFTIRKPGDYQLHLQMRLIQVGKDPSGKLHYLVTWLPEVTAKVAIQLKDIPRANLSPSAETNSLAK